MKLAAYQRGSGFYQLLVMVSTPFAFTVVENPVKTRTPKFPNIIMVPLALFAVNEV